jgi:hypothetical protein
MEPAVCRDRLEAVRRGLLEATRIHGALVSALVSFESGGASSYANAAERIAQLCAELEKSGALMRQASEAVLLLLEPAGAARHFERDGQSLVALAPEIVARYNEGA